MGSFPIFIGKTIENSTTISSFHRKTIAKSIKGRRIMAFENKTKELRRAMNTEIIGLLLDTNLTLEEIARKSGCTLSTVYNTARKNNLRRKDRKAATGVENGR